MTRDFIFDENGAVIGYRCRVIVRAAGKMVEPPPLCTARPFNTARGLWQHQYRAHGLHQQLTLISTVETANVMKGTRGKTKIKG